MKTVYSSAKEQAIAEQRQVVVVRNKRYGRVRDNMTDLYVQKSTVRALVHKRKRIKMVEWKKGGYICH